MGSERPAFLSFNRGEVAGDALTRVDVERLRLSAEIQENWQAFVLGPMMLRPGTEHIGSVNGDLRTRLIPFVFGNRDRALLECTHQGLRVWNVLGDDEVLVTRVAVSTVVTNGSFSSATGWTLTETGAGAEAVITSGELRLSSPALGGLAQAKRSVSVASGDQAKEHALRIVVTRGPVTFRCGTTDGADDLIGEASLDTGVHSLTFTPGAATVYIQLETISATRKIVDSITVEGAGPLVLPTSWTESDLPYLRFDQEGDIVFVACRGQWQRKIERRATTAWSFVLYKSDDGPFMPANGTDLTMTPSVLTGNGTLTASRNHFRSGHIGSLIRLFSSGQTVTASLSAENTFTNAIRVTGVGATRIFSRLVTGTWDGTLTLQRSFDGPTSGYADVANVTNGSANFNDDLANSICWYRIGFKTGNYVSGTAVITLNYAGGGEAGVARIVSLQSATVADIEVLRAFSSLTATDNWSEAEWSERIGFPDVLCFNDGRLCHFTRNRFWGSASDAFYTFDPGIEGDSAPINRSIGSGPGDQVNWALALGRLLVGRESQEVSVRASSLDEPLTNTALSSKACSTQGSAPVMAVKVDTRGVFVEKSGRRVYELQYNVEIQDYQSADLTRLNPDIGVPGFVDLAVQRQPDTQVHCLLGNGQAAVLLYDKQDQVEGWLRFVSDGAGGEIEAVAVLPGNLEDRVYYVVKRTIGGATKRFLERFARRDQCTGRPEARCADSHVMYSGAAVTTIGGLSHLEGETVVVWGWNTATPFTVELPDGTEAEVGRDFGSFTVSGGQITGLAAAVTDACVGLPYRARFKSAKLAYAASRGTPLTQKKKLDKIGLIVADTHHQGLLYGQELDADEMDDLPQVEEGETVETDTVWPELDAPMTALPGDWDTDARLCLMAQAPRPCKLRAAVITVSTNG